MPTYEYQCEECGEVFEVFRHFDEMDEKMRCPNCSSERTRRLFSIPYIEGETVAGSGYGTKLSRSGPGMGGRKGLGRGLGRGRGMGRTR